MYSHTKKVGSAGRYGVRVGRRLRIEVRKVEDAAKKPSECPGCGKPTIKRKSPGVFTCNSCKLKFAGSAYIPSGKPKTAEEVK